jgi:hypothetical protein
MVRKSSKAARAAAGAMKLFDGLLAEKAPKVSADEIARIERDFSSFGGALNVNRRMALMYLSKPFAETAKSIREDRNLAVAFAALDGALEDSIAKYQNLVEILSMAQTRLKLAFCQREDMQEVVAEGHASLTTNPDYSKALLEIPTAPQTH